MSRRVRKLCAILTAVAILVTGCQPARPFYFLEDGDMSHYKGVATELEYPDVQQASLAEVSMAEAPLTLMNSESREIWDLRLEDAIQIALANSKVMRNIGGQVRTFNTLIGGSLQPPFQLLSNPTLTRTVYAPAIVESDPRFGVEGALSQFDAQWNTSMFWERNDRPQNQVFQGLLPSVFEQDLGTFQSAISKRLATGGQATIRNNTAYQWNNNQSNRFPSFWDANFETEFRHPLLQGAGEQFNRIAGPNAVDGFYNGVVIARINVDIALADFEAGVRDLVSDTEIAYWRLYFAYRDLASKLAGRDSSLESWRKVYTLLQAGAKGGEAEKEAQAREQYFLFRAQVEQASSDLFAIENQLRFMMGIAATDGRLIRPIDEPTTAFVKFDWHEVHDEALARSPEVRQHRWQIKKREMELIAAKNFLLPRLDAVGLYRWRGYGNDLLGYGDDLPQFDNAYQTLFDGQFQEWQMGFQFQVPIGFRQALSGVRNAQLNVARERAILEDQELELSHQLSNALRDLDRNYTLTQTNFNRRVAAQNQVAAVQAAYDTGTVTFDLLLDAQRRLADAESQYYNSLVNYNLSIEQVHYRKNSLLEYNSVYLAEGPWPAKAYVDARRRARERDAGIFMNYGYTRPNVFSVGPVPQNWGGNVGTQMPAPADPSETQPELVPTPTPTPAPAQDGLPYGPTTMGAPTGGQDYWSGAAAAPATGAPYGVQPAPWSRAPEVATTGWQGGS